MRNLGILSSATGKCVCVCLYAGILTKNHELCL